MNFNSMTREQLEAELRRCNDWMAADGKTIGELLATLETIATGSIVDTGENQLGTVNIDFETAKKIARATVEKHTP